jgi:hypothetical protein
VAAENDGPGLKTTADSSTEFFPGLVDRFMVA